VGAAHGVTADLRDRLDARYRAVCSGVADPRERPEGASGNVLWDEGEAIEDVGAELHPDRVDTSEAP